jgi:hypothetical protein
MDQEIRGKAVNESQIKTRNGDVVQSPVHVPSDKVGEEVVVRGDQVTRRIDS